MRPLAALLVLTLGLAGCLGTGAPPLQDPEDVRPATVPDVADEEGPAVPPASPAPEPVPESWPRCAHPWPCGDGSEWPRDLAGPFELARTEHLRVPTSQGELDGWVFLPSLPEGVRAPVVLEATPYPGTCGFFNLAPFCSPAPGHAFFTATQDPGWSHLPRIRAMWEAGYAFAMVNLPGTGASDGCYDAYGPAGQRALAELVEWLAAQAWSNGRVGMYGISASGTSPFAAAVENPPALKTIVPAGIISNLYTFLATPQGALASYPFHLFYGTSVSAMPPAASAPEAATVGYAEDLPSRACEDLRRYMTDATLAHATDQRDGDFWEARRLIARFPDITTSVFVDHGFRDAFGSGHAFQEDDVWGALERAPKRMLLGQWAHQYPPEESLRGSRLGEDWNAVLLPWLDFWLKGLGDAPPRLGLVDYEDAAGDWRADHAWPPTAAREEALFLAGPTLATAPAEARASVSLRPSPDPRPAVCDALHPLPSPPDGLPALPLGAPVALAPTAVAFVAEPAVAPVVLAGNPFLLLRLESDQPGGSVEGQLWDLGPGFTCGPEGPEDARWLSAGAADLRFHTGTYDAEDFPVGEPRQVRLDLWNVAHRLEPGHHLAVVLARASRNGEVERHAPTLAVLGGDAAAASQLVLPIVEGTAGGRPPAAQAPPRPFVGP